MSQTIILIQSTTASSQRTASREQYGFFPVGLLYLSSMLRLHGYGVHLVDLYTENFSLEGFKAHLERLCGHPLAVGIGSYTDSFGVSLEVASIVKDVFPDTAVIAGGPHVSFRPAEALRSPHVDYVIRGEAEGSLIMLLEYLKAPSAYPLEKTTGIAYRLPNGEIHESSMAPGIADLDSLPFPDYSLVLGRRYRDIFSFVSSRGCPGDCIFCASKAFSGAKYRFHSAEWIFSLVYYYWNRTRFRAMAPYDDTFTANRKRLEKVCSYLTANGMDIRWNCKSRVDAIDGKRAATLKKAGCTSVHLGVESGDQRILDSICKHITMKQVFRALKALKENAIGAECSFIIGLPSDTLETMTKTLILADVIEEMDLGTCAVAVATPFPGTRLCEDSESLGIEILTRNWFKYNLYNPICVTPGFRTGHLRRGMYFFQYERKTGRRTPGLMRGDREEEIRAEWVTTLENACR